MASPYRIYIIGRLLHFSAAFDAEAARIRARGWDVANPVHDYSSTTSTDRFIADIAAMVLADEVRVLKCGALNPRAVIERGIAAKVGLPIRQAAG